MVIGTSVASGPLSDADIAFKALVDRAQGTTFVAAPSAANEVFVSAAVVVAE
jgi:hypothetical protein